MKTNFSKSLLAVPMLFLFSTTVQATVTSVGKVNFKNNGNIVIKANGVNDARLSTFAGIDTGGLDLLSSGDAKRGSAIQESVYVDVGYTLSFDWKWFNKEGLNSTNNDFAFIDLSLGDTDVLVDTQAANKSKGAFTWAATEAGLLTYTIATLNVNNNRASSKLVVKNFSIPEPALLGVFGLALFGFGVTRRIKK